MIAFDYLIVITFVMLCGWVLIIGGWLIGTLLQLAVRHVFKREEKSWRNS